ncbi:MAG: hypothetical protein P9X24_08290 [Candidatus Hatepunaea meridiana]|nr:hypothetical protein [Candidatus Hatepunaea meridiana]
MISISAKGHADHYKWISRTLDSICRDSFLTRKPENFKIIHSLIFVANKGTSNSRPQFPRLKSDILLKTGIDLFVEFSEEIIEVNRRRHSHDRMAINKFSLVIRDENSNEILAFHLCYDDNDDSPYQPHLHINASSGVFEMGRVHIPMSTSPVNWQPSGITEYEKWIKMLLDFVTKDFPK